jgi:acyl carrier protein
MKEKVKGILVRIIAEELQIDETDILGEDSLSSLGADSIDTVSILMKVEEELGIDIEDATEATANETVDELVIKIQKLL